MAHGSGTRRFRDRREAGHALASSLGAYAGRSDVIVLALPRGGVPVAYEIASSLGAPLDVFSVRKLGVPGHEELAMGAIGSGEALILNADVIDTEGISEAELSAAVERERRELERRERLYREGRPFPNLTAKTAILVDDGLATGASMLAAIAALRRHRPAHVVVAVPVAPPETCAMLRRRVETLVCTATPEPFGGVGAWYDDFDQVGDDDVRALLDAAARRARL
jgi:predicted phosphoribosyltransferase